MKPGAFSTTRILALAVSFGGHAGIVAWLLLAPGSAPLPEQRIVNVDFVAASVPESTPQPPMPEQVAAPVKRASVVPLPVSPRGIVEPAAPPPTASPSPKTRLTTGRPSPDATRAISAVTQADADAKPLNNPAPAYPPLARKRGHEGTVLLRVEISPQGEALHVTVLESSGYASLDNAAADAVRDWRFTPAQKQGNPIAGTLRLPIVFRLD